jgi:hypothetical protein
MEIALFVAATRAPMWFSACTSKKPVCGLSARMAFRCSCLKPVPAEPATGKAGKRRRRSGRTSALREMAFMVVSALR